MYCESKVSHVYYGDVEHLRPKSKFPEFEFDWDNLGYVCARCNGEKLDKWSHETPFINPFIEEPDEHLAALGPFIYHRSGSERGEYTWRELGLNRPDLIERRIDRIDRIRDLIDKTKRTRGGGLRELIMTKLEEELEDSQEYCMTSRAAFAQLR
jgi:hypothetical protein